MLKAFSTVLLIAVSTAASAAQSPEPNTQPTIVVVGERVQAYRERLAACIARNCPPNEDIDATTALAEALFVQGEYEDARTELLRSIRRNRRHAAGYPEPVSDLYRANARVSRHLGFDADVRRSTWQILRSLQAGLPTEDHRHFTARFEVIEWLIAFNYHDQAQHELRELADVARAAGRDDVVASAELRGLWVAFIQAPNSSMPMRQLIEMSESPDARRSLGAKIMLVRIYNHRRDRRRANALIAQLGMSGARRQLLFDPPYQLVQREDGSGDGRAGALRSVTDRPQLQQGQEASTTLVIANLADRMTDNFVDQLIDVGFRIRADGSVADVQVVNRRGPAGWDRPLLRALLGRRYSPTQDGSESYRLERYTYTSERRLHGLTGTHIGNRSPRGRVEFHELSETVLPAAQSPAAATPPAGSPGS